MWVGDVVSGLQLIRTVICIHCGESRATSGRNHICAECSRERYNKPKYMRKYRQRHKDRVSERERRRRKTSKFIQVRNKWNINNKDKIRDATKKHRRRNIDSIGDSYVRRMFVVQLGNSGVCIQPEDIPRRLIKLKREQLKLHRAIKEKAK